MKNYMIKFLVFSDLKIWNNQIMLYKLSYSLFLTQKSKF